MRVLRSVPVHRFGQIQEDGRLCLRECIALDAAAFGGSQFYVDVIIGQPDLVISGRSLLVLMGETGMNTQGGFCFLIRQGDRQERNVIQVSGSCAR